MLAVRVIIQLVVILLTAPLLKAQEWQYLNNNAYYNSGLVGINTSIPGAFLEINATSPGFSSGFHNNLRLKATAPAMQWWDDNHNNGWQVGSEGGHLYFGSLTSQTSQSYRLFLKSDGNVGIGTTTPTSLLDVNGTSAFRNNLTVDFGATNRRIQLRDNGIYLSRLQDGLYASSITADGHMIFGTRNGYRFNFDGVQKVTFHENGNVGIGTVTPSSLLHVNGTARIDNQLSVYKPFTSESKIVEFGLSSGNASSLSVAYGSTSDFVTLNIGDAFALKRGGGGAPSIVTPRSELYFFTGNNVSIITNSGAPGELRLTGNYNLGHAKFGAYNSATGLLVIGNSFNNYQHSQITRFRNGSIQVIDNNNVIKAALTESGDLALGLTIPTAQLHTTGTVRFAGLTNDDTHTRVLVSDANGNIFYRSATTLGSGTASGWALTGNSIGAGTKLGTTNNESLPFITNNTERMRIDAVTGNVGIGTTNINDVSYKLYVETGIRTRKVKVDLAVWADHVFYPTYQLRPLHEVEQYIQKHYHLPEVPSAAEVEKNGLDLGDNQATLLKKIEELTLYMIDQNKKMEQQQLEINELRKELKQYTGK